VRPASKKLTLLKPENSFWKPWRSAVNVNCCGTCWDPWLGLSWFDSLRDMRWSCSNLQFIQCQEKSWNLKAGDVRTRVTKVTGNSAWVITDPRQDVCTWLDSQFAAVFKKSMGFWRYSMVLVNVLPLVWQRAVLPYHVHNVPFLFRKMFNMLVQFLFHSKYIQLYHVNHVYMTWSMRQLSDHENTTQIPDIGGE